jgi:hypothetical protein
MFYIAHVVDNVIGNVYCSESYDDLVGIGLKMAEDHGEVSSEDKPINEHIEMDGEFECNDGSIIQIFQVDP